MQTEYGQILALFQSLCPSAGGRECILGAFIKRFCCSWIQVSETGSFLFLISSRISSSFSSNSLIITELFLLASGAIEFAFSYLFLFYCFKNCILGNTKLPCHNSLWYLLIVKFDCYYSFVIN